MTAPKPIIDLAHSIKWSTQDPTGVGKRRNRPQANILFREGDIYHRYYSFGPRYQEILATFDRSVSSSVAQVIDCINQHHPVIKQWQLLPGGIYLACAAIEGDWDLAHWWRRFDSKQEAVHHAADQVLKLWQDVYPFCVTDIAMGNIVQLTDNSWVNIDFDDFFYKPNVWPWYLTDANHQAQWQNYQHLRASGWPAECNNLQQWRELPEWIQRKCVQYGYNPEVFAHSQSSGQQAIFLEHVHTVWLKLEQLLDVYHDDHLRGDLELLLKNKLKTFAEGRI